ncbi:MAG: MBL fold metallo-hydrolase [Pseudomonadota bacterium]
MIRPSLSRTTALFALSASLLATTGLAVLGAGNAHAAAPMVKTSAPAYYRVMLGDFEITALSDGTTALPVDKLLTNTKGINVSKQLAKSYLKSPVETSFNGFLINTGSKLILVDTGAGKLFGPTLGNLLANLKAAGYQPEQVDEIYITHMHPDHVGGLMADDKLAFPNAIVRAQKNEADYWLSQANLDKAPADSKGFFQGAMASVNPYVSAGKFKPFEGDTELAPGIRAIAGHGHTAGHSAYAIESKGEKLLLLGDMIHVAAVQFEHPEVTLAFDSDSKTAALERKKTFTEAAKAGYLVAGAHLSFPGMGRLRAEGKGYAWVPLNYLPVR